MIMNCKISLDDITTQKTAAELISLGYRRTSWAYCHVSRIDREDWLKTMAKQLGCAVADFYREDGQGVSGQWCDYYRRCISKDTHTVHPETVKLIPSSMHDSVGFIPEVGL